MDSRKAKRRSVAFSTPFIVFLIALALLVMTNVRVFAASQSFRVVYPTEIHAGDPLKFHVTFSTPPPTHVFYMLEVTVDGQPVAMADLSEERSTWITAPPQKPGRHTLAVIWRNPPEGSPVSDREELFILPNK